MNSTSKSPRREGKRWFIVGVAAFLYLLSFALPVLEPLKPDSPRTGAFGWEAFQIGWMALVSFEVTDLDWWIFGTVWLANPAIWLSILCIMRRTWKLSLLSSGMAILISIPAPFQGASFIDSLPGYWTWLSSSVFLFVASGWAVYSDSRAVQKTELALNGLN
jgi:hypothetical protein